MIVETLPKNVTVNYTYYLAEDREFSKLEKLVFKYSFLSSTIKHGFKVNIHCNERFKDLCCSIGIIPDKFIPLEEEPSINFKTFWAYHKIKVYDKQPIGEWHLDVDAVFKGTPILHEDVDLIAAHDDIPLDKDKKRYQFPVIEIPDNYKFPNFTKFSLHGLNASTLLFNSQELKDIYCNNALNFMRNNSGISKNNWEYMVFIEQASLKQICEYYNYSYKFLVDSCDYYHLGPTKKILSKKDTLINIALLNNRIRSLCLQSKTLLI